MRTNVINRTIALLTAFVVGYATPHGLIQKKGPSPFVVSVVPAWSGQLGRGISMAADTRDIFYVLLTNVSQEPQGAFLTWNSWGYYAVSFELQTAEGHSITIRKKPTEFPRNIPSTFIIPPGEQMVYPIKLDDEWEATVPLPIADDMQIPVTLKAIYEIEGTSASAQQKVWVGRAQSRKYQLNFRHWVGRPSAD